MFNRVDVFRLPEIEGRTSNPVRGKTGERQSESNFEKILREEELAFSLHAQRRIQERSLSIDAETLESLGESVKILERKGAKNSLVVVGNTAFVVNVPQKMVVTCFDRKASKENVFTNIDSAIIL